MPVFIFILGSYVGSYLLNWLLIRLSRKITFKWLIVISALAIVIAYYYLFIRPYTIFNLIIIIIFHVLNAHIYWLARHYFALGMGNELKVSKLVILSQLALIPAPYLGSYLITYLNFYIVLLIIIVLYLVTIIPLFHLRQEKKILIKKHKGSLKIPLRMILFFAVAQMRVVGRYLFPLYIYLYIKSTYTYLGLFNLFVGITSMLFIYVWGQKQLKRGFFLITCMLCSLVWLLKLTVLGPGLFLIVGFGEGLVEKMYEVSFYQKLYGGGSGYDRLTYVGVMEGLQSGVRILIMVGFILIGDLRMILMVGALMLIVIGIVGVLWME